jgi:hypothetical protein
MNYHQRTIFPVFLLVVGLCSYSQQMVQTPKDIDIICQHDDKFVGKPLKYLFQEIKPAITLVLAQEGWVPEVAPRFTFFFIPMNVYKKYRQQDKFPLRLIVYLRAPFQWEVEKRKGFEDRDHYLDWTKKDEETYGNCIITAIRLAGEYNECDY